jgi:hypothetical protein
MVSRAVGAGRGGTRTVCGGRQTKITCCGSVSVGHAATHSVFALPQGSGWCAHMSPHGPCQEGDPLLNCNLPERISQAPASELSNFQHVTHTVIFKVVILFIRVLCFVLSASYKWSLPDYQ